MVWRSKDFVSTLEKKVLYYLLITSLSSKNKELWRWPSVHDVLGTCSFWALVKTASCCQGLNFQCVHSIECKMNREDALVCVWAQRIITHFFHHRRSNWFLFSWGMTTGRHRIFFHGDYWMILLISCAIVALFCMVLVSNRIREKKFHCFLKQKCMHEH